MKQQKNKKIRILVVGIGGPAGINICKILKKYKKNFDVYGVEIANFPVIPKLVDHFSEYPKEYDENIIFPWYENFIRKNKIDVVIQTVAEALILMNKMQEKIGKKCKIIVSDALALGICHEKDKLYTWMDENFPEYMGKWQRLDTGSWKNGEAIFPATEYFIKPIVGRGSRGCRKVSSEELNFLLKSNPSEISKFVAMEILPGKEWTVDCYVNFDGTFSYVVPRQRLALSGGISSMGKTDNNKIIIEQTKKVLERMSKFSKVYGPVFIQWKLDKNNLPKMVEINPRASGGLAITALAGANPIESLLAEIKGKPICNKKWKEITVVRYFEEVIVK